MSWTAASWGEFGVRNTLGVNTALIVDQIQDVVWRVLELKEGSDLKNIDREKQRLSWHVFFSWK